MIHEIGHVDQARRLGGESSFACAYGRGYIGGGGSRPPYLANRDDLTAYDRNPLEAEAYTFDARYRDDSGGVVAAKLST